VQGRRLLRYALIFASSALNLCAGQYGSAQSVNAESEKAPPLPTQTAPNKKKPRLDPARPLNPFNGIYPQQSQKSKEEGLCWISAMVDTDGSIRAIQLLTSTGFQTLDAACLLLFPGQQMLPATTDGKPVVAWLDIPQLWSLGKSNPKPRPPIPDSVPHMMDNFNLQVGPAFYTASSRELRQEGNCIVYMHVEDTGVVADPRIVLSSKFPALDLACLEAAAHAQFIPGKVDGRPVGTSTYLAMYWRLQ
jgi:TonB family protein